MCIEASVSRQRKISFRWIPNVTHWLCKVNQFDYCWVAIFAFDEDDAEKFAPGFLRSTKSKTRFYPNRSLQIFRRLVTFSWIRWIRLCKERGQNKSFCSHRWIFFVFPTQQKTPKNVIYELLSFQRKYFTLFTKRNSCAIDLIR